MFAPKISRIRQYWLTFFVHTVVLATLSTGAAADADEDYLVGRKQIPHNPIQLSNADIIKYSKLSDDQQLQESIHNILIPRVVGTTNHTIVRQYIVNILRNLNWHVELDSFHATAPIVGTLNFHNIIATLNPDAERYLVLACHYDSKYMPDVEFVGATDSAVPCGMLLNLAHVLQDPLNQFRKSNVSLMLLFFDGEEAFDQWGPEDSIYGSRHLAQLWEKQKKLDRIDLLVLLDLLGAPDPRFYSYFENTSKWHMHLLGIEYQLAETQQLNHYANSGVAKRNPTSYFQPQATRSSIEDDHIPFLRRNVPILHLIPLPFPNEWHTVNDNQSIIDYQTTHNLALIIRIFVMEYLLGSGGSG